jgi:hypothetical protein
VLMHNGGREAAIAAHVATLLRPGGHLSLIEADMPAFRFDPDDPDLADLWAQWLTLMHRRGNDPSIGIRLASLARGVGLDVVLRDARWYCQPREVGVRLAAWAARDALVADGLATPADIARWDAAFDRFDTLPGEKVYFVPQFRVVGRAGGVAAARLRRGLATRNAERSLTSTAHRPPTIDAPTLPLPPTSNAHDGARPRRPARQRGGLRRHDGKDRAAPWGARSCNPSRANDLATIT